MCGFFTDFGIWCDLDPIYRENKERVEIKTVVVFKAEFANFPSSTQLLGSNR